MVVPTRPASFSMQSGFAVEFCHPNSRDYSDRISVVSLDPKHVLDLRRVERGLYVDCFRFVETLDVKARVFGPQHTLHGFQQIGGHYFVGAQIVSGRHAQQLFEQTDDSSLKTMLDRALRSTDTIYFGHRNPIGSSSAMNPELANLTLLRFAHEKGPVYAAYDPSIDTVLDLDGNVVTEITDPPEDPDFNAYTGRIFQVRFEGGACRVTTLPSNRPDGDQRTAVLMFAPRLAEDDLTEPCQGNNHYAGVGIYCDACQGRRLDPPGRTPITGIKVTHEGEEEDSGTQVEMQQNHGFPRHGVLSLVRGDKCHTFIWDGIRLKVRTKPATE